MQLGQLLRDNYHPERVDYTLKCIEVMMAANYLYAENDIEMFILSNDNMPIDTMLREIEDKISDHLYYMLQEYGFTFQEESNPSMTQLYFLNHAINELQKYNSVEALLDIYEGNEDVIGAFVECFDLVVPELPMGNSMDYYGIIQGISPQFWHNLTLVLDGTREDIIDFDAGIGDNTKIPDNKGVVWQWISDSGRTGYNLEAAGVFVVPRIEELVSGELPNPAELQLVLLELMTLVTYSSTEYSDERVYSLLEEMYPDEVKLVQRAQGILPYIELYDIE